MSEIQLFQIDSGVDNAVDFNQLIPALTPSKYISIERLLIDGFGNQIFMTYLPVVIYAKYYHYQAISTVSVTSNLNTLPPYLRKPGSKIIFNVCTLSSHRNQGHSTELLNTVIFYTFQDPNCERIYIEVLPSNESAHRLYLKLGFINIYFIPNEKVIMELSNT